MARARATYDRLASVYDLVEEPFERRAKSTCLRMLAARPGERMLEVGQFRNQAAGALSGGTRQKLNLTLALLHDPDVLLLDEPYQGFDWETYLRFWDVVDDLRARDKAVVIITHLVFEQDRYDVLADLAGGRLTNRTPSQEDHHATR